MTVWLDRATPYDLETIEIMCSVIRQADKYCRNSILLEDVYILVPLASLTSMPSQPELLHEDSESAAGATLRREDGTVERSLMAGRPQSNTPNIRKDLL